MLALTLTHCVTSGEALPLPGAPFPHLLTGINDLSKVPCCSAVLGTAVGG